MSTITCPACSAENVPGGAAWPYCQACGKRLAGSGVGSGAGTSTSSQPAAEAPKSQMTTGHWIGFVVGAVINSLVVYTGPLRESGLLVQFGVGAVVLYVCMMIGSALFSGGEK